MIRAQPGEEEGRRRRWCRDVRRGRRQGTESMFEGVDNIMQYMLQQVGDVRSSGVLTVDMQLRREE